jgi:hypothetical protein
MPSLIVFVVIFCIIVLLFNVVMVVKNMLGINGYFFSGLMKTDSGLLDVVVSLVGVAALAAVAGYVDASRVGLVIPRMIAT